MQPIQISIPQQCHENWDQMKPADKGRFCNACATQVVDFSVMSDTELLNYFSNLKSSNVCGRALPEQLNRDISSVPVKQRWYWHYAMAFLFFFSKSTAAKAQGLVKVAQAPALKKLPPPQLKKYSTHTTPGSKLTIEGNILDSEGQPVPFASIRLLQSTTGVSADESGHFELQVDSVPCMLEISALDFTTKQLPVTNFLLQTIVLNRVAKTLQELVIANTVTLSTRSVTMGMMVVKCTKSYTFKDTLQRFANFIKPSVVLYPNPVGRGNTLTVSITLKKPGAYTLYLADASGRMMQQTKINAIAKKHSEELIIGSNWSNGIYFLRVTNEQGKPAGSGSFVIQ